MTGYAAIRAKWLGKTIHIVLQKGTFRKTKRALLHGVFGRVFNYLLLSELGKLFSAPCCFAFLDFAVGFRHGWGLSWRIAGAGVAAGRDSPLVALWLHHGAAVVGCNEAVVAGWMAV